MGRYNAHYYEDTMLSIINLISPFSVHNVYIKKDLIDTKKEVPSLIYHQRKKVMGDFL
jgi:hypothetical protein